jgi:hypothetical protein
MSGYQGSVWADGRRYFEGGISSVYLWDMDDGFAGCVLLKKGVYRYISNIWLC